MKKAMIVVLLTLATTVVFYSCSKKQDIVTPATSQVAAKSTISQEQFLSYMAANVPTRVDKNLWRWLKVIWADFTGLVEHGNLGDAAWASALAIINPPGGGGTPIKHFKPNGNWSTASNPKNPYDNAGELHNLALYEFITNSDAYALPGSTNTSFKVDYTKVAAMFSKIFSTNTTAASVSNSTDFHNNILPKYASVQEYAYKNGNIDAFVYNTMNDYSRTISSFSSAGQIYDYSVRVEAQLMASDANAKDKEILLSAFSIARYSSVFWASCVVSEPTPSAVPTQRLGKE